MKDTIQGKWEEAREKVISEWEEYGVEKYIRDLADEFSDAMGVEWEEKNRRKIVSLAQDLTRYWEEGKKMDFIEKEIPKELKEVLEK